MGDDILVDPLTRLLCESALLDYDPADSAAVKHIREISLRTHCMFARRTSFWGSRDWEEGISLEENVRRSLPALRRFVLATRRDEVEIFVVEVVGKNYFASLVEFGRTVWRVLKVISDDDPSGVHSLNSPLAGQTDKGWIMYFGGLPLFVLTFCPLYPPTHSRHMFGTNPSSCFLLLTSGAAFHDAGEFNLSAEELKTLPSLAGLSDRDRIRAGFLRAGCPFNVENAHCVVRPLDDFTDEQPHWWDARECAADFDPSLESAESDLLEDASLDDLVAAQLNRSLRNSQPRLA